MTNFYRVAFFWFCFSFPFNLNIFGQCPPGPTTQPTAIGGTNPVCPGQVVVYSTTVGTDAASTTWSVPGGWTINGTTLTTLTTTAGAASGNVCVYAWSAGCGNSATTCAFITVNSNSTDPAAFTISTNPICPGNSTTLGGISGGSLGTGANWQWYSGGCGVTGVGTGSSIAVSPATTTQYWVRAEGTCNVTNCATNTVTVNATSTAATSASAAPNTICVGNSTTLSLSGGALGTGANWQWYSSGCGGTFEGTGASLAVSPVVTTTYYVRAEGTCNTTSCVSVTVTVNTNSTDPVSASATPNPDCLGTPTSLSVTGGSLGSGAQWQWYSGGCGGTLEGTGNPLSVSPVAMTTYYARAEGTCNTTVCVSVTVTVNAQPSANAGIDGSECDLDHLLSATPSIGTGTWTQAGGTGATSFSNANDPNATATATAYGAYTYTWTEDNSGCISSDNVVVTYYQQPVSFAGNDATVCGSLSTNFAAVPSAGTGTWAQVSGPGVSGYSNPNASNAVVTVSTWGVYTYSWTENNGGCTSSDQVVISFYQQPVANAGTSTDQCDLDFTFNATASVGTGTWTKVVGPGSVSFSDPNSPTAIATVTLYGSYLFRWTEVNGGCSDFDDVTVNFFEQPVADGGPDAIICGLNYNMQAVYTSGTGTWTFVNGPGSSSFSNPNSVNTNVTVSAIGVYTYEWFCDNNGCQDRDTVTLNFTSPTPPVADAGADDSYCGLGYTLAAVPSLGTGTWTQVLGTGTSSFSNANDPNATVTVNNYGLYVFRWTEVNGNCSDDDDVTINFNMIPVADAGFDDSSCTMSYMFNASATTGIQAWSQIAGPGSSSYSNPNSTVAKVTVTTTGLYTYQWAVNNNGCISSDTIIVYFGSQPAANAGAGGNECDLDYVFSAVPSTGTGTWSQISGPGTTNYSNANSATATATSTVYGTYIYRWTEVNGTCSSNDDITVNYYAPPLADAGLDGSSCTLSYTFNASSGGTGTWSQVAGAGTSSFSNINSPIATVTVSATGVYTYEWSANNNGCTSADTAVVDFSASTVADAGAAGNECDLDFIFSAVPSTGTGTWSQVSGPGTTNFSNANSPTATATATNYGTYIYRWTEVNGTCSSSDDATVNFYTPPLADAGPDDSLCALNYAFNASSSTGTGAWSQASGPGSSSFLNLNSPTTTVTVSAVGTYYFEWAVNNNGCILSDTIRIKFNDPPTAYAGTDKTECDMDVVLAASIGPGTGTWTQQGGPGTATFTDVNNPADSVTVSMYGTYIFRWTKLVGVCTVYDEVTVNFFTSPLADAGSDNTICFLNYPFNASSSTGSGTWSQTGGAGVSSFTNVSSPTSVVSVSATGIYTYEWAVNNNGCVSSDTVIINFSAPPVANAGTGGNECDFDYIFNAVPSVGTGTWTQVSGPGSSSFSNANDPAAVSTVSAYGTYVYRWTEVSGTCSSYDDVNINFFMPPLADAGNDNSSCSSDYSFNASTSTGSGTWSQLSGPGTSSYSNSNSPIATVTVSMPGIYTYEWAVNNYGCLSSDTIVLTFSPPPAANAGADATDCGLDITLNAIPSTGVGTWSQYFGPGTSSFSNINDPNATVNVTLYGTYVFRWTEVSGSCSGADEVTVNFFMPPAVSAGADQNICGSQYFLSASSSTGTGTWNQLSGPGTASFSNINNPSTTVTVSLIGNYQLQWSANNNGCVSADTIDLAFDNPLIIDAGSDGKECDLDFIFSAISSSGTGLWTKVLGPGGSAFADSTDPATTVTVSSYGTYIFQWKETSGSCSDSDLITVDFAFGPSSDAGADGTTCGQSLSLNAVPSTGTGTWSQVLGTGVAGFAMPANPTTAVSVSQFGTYVFRWTETNGVCTDYDDVTVTFYEQPSAYAGAGGYVCDTIFNLVATASVGTGLWSQQSGGGTSAFSATNSPQTSATVSAYGTYVFQWLETNGICTSSDTVTVNFYRQPVANAGASGKECDKDYTFSAIPSAGTGAWSMIVGNGTSAFSDANSPISSVTVSNTGTYIFRWTEANGICSDYEDVVVNFYPEPVAFAGNDTVISLGNSALLHGEGGDYFQWSPDSTLDNPNIAKPIASPAQDESYRLIVTTIYGCSDTDEVTVAVKKDYNFGVSEVITPNGDGFNEQWKIDNIDFYTGCDVSIYNRYGNLVFEKKDYKNDWNGKYNGKPMPDGTYYYVIKCSGSDETWTGPLTILK